MAKKVPVKKKRLRKPPLSVDQILAWVQEHHRRTGQWPMTYTGAVRGVTGESWNGIDQALRKGNRGLPAGLSLRRLYEQQGWK